MHEWLVQCSLFLLTLTLSAHFHFTDPWFKNFTWSLFDLTYFLFWLPCNILIKNIHFTILFHIIIWWGKTEPQKYKIKFFKLGHIAWSTQYNTNRRADCFKICADLTAKKLPFPANELLPSFRSPYTNVLEKLLSVNQMNSFPNTKHP